MLKYLAVFKISWQNGFVYRLNFIMWRVRTILQFFAVYFLWLAIFSREGSIFTYDRSIMLTYIIITSFLRSFVLSSRSVTIGTEIATGDLNNYLIKPISYLKNWLARDFADKLLNIIFVIGELTLLILIFKPPLLPPASLLYLFWFVIAAGIAMLMYFFFSFLVSSFAFWYPEHNGWPLRFIIFMVIEFLAGGLFPLDIFPEAAFKVFRLLPPAYFLFYPAQIYLGRVQGPELMAIFAAMLVWLVILYQATRLVWHKGLKIYGAYGR